MTTGKNFMINYTGNSSRERKRDVFYETNGPILANIGSREAILANMAPLLTCIGPMLANMGTQGPMLANIGTQEPILVSTDPYWPI